MLMDDILSSSITDGNREKKHWVKAENVVNKIDKDANCNGIFSILV